MSEKLVIHRESTLFFRKYVCLEINKKSLFVNLDILLLYSILLRFLFLMKG